MALLTEGRINQFGVNEEYWRILNINISLQYGYCDVTVGAYANGQSRASGAEPMNTKKIRAKWDDEEFFKYFAPTTFESDNQATTLAISEDAQVMSSNIYERVYEYIKQKDDYFSEAIDC